MAGEVAYEYGVLLCGCLSPAYRLYERTESPEAMHMLLYIGTLALVSAILEKAELPLTISRNGSSGLFYGYVLVPAIVLQCSTQLGGQEKWLLTISTELSQHSTFMILCSITLQLLNKCSVLIRVNVKIFILVIAVACSLYLVFDLPMNLIFLRVTVCLLIIKATSHFLPRCFTSGELLLLYNLLAVFISIFTLNEYYFKLNSEPAMIASWVLLFVTAFLASLAPIRLVSNMSSLYFYTSGSSLLICLISILSKSLTPNAILWLTNFMQDNWPHRQLLLTFWMTEILIAVLYVGYWRTNGEKSSTSERKCFHILILLTYIPGIRSDLPLLFICSVGATCILLITEAMRVLEVAPFEHILNKQFIIFLDSQDSGRLILTPLYLILGQSLPIWANCFKDQDLLKTQYSNIPISTYSGILSVGIGDTVASVIGSKFGKHKWRNSNKTIEGTVAAVMAQSLYAIFVIGGYSHAVYLIFAIISTSLVEAFTFQIDNLILPVYMYFLLNGLK